MRLLLAILLAVAMLPAQAETVNFCERTENVRFAIKSALGCVESVTTSCPCTAEAEELASLERLSVPSAHPLAYPGGGLTESLRAGDFDGLTGLQELTVDARHLTTLPAAAFDGATSLERLTLSCPRELPAGASDVLTNLQELDLGWNLVREVYGFGPCYVGGLTTLPADAFDNMPRLRVLTLTGNPLTLPAEAFDNMTRLQELRLAHMGLTTLPAGVFDSLSGLQELWLNNNRFSTTETLEDDRCASVYNCRTTLPAGVFDGLTSLQELDLTYNRLWGLRRYDVLFDELPSGVSISLEPQGDEDGGSDEEDGGTVDICHRTTEVQDAIEEALQLDALYDCSAVDVTTLETLDLQGKELTSLLPGDFDGLTSLRVLRLNDNELWALPGDLFDDLTNLRELWLNDNRLGLVPHDLFYGLTNLRVLRLERNELTNLGFDPFDGLTSLQELWLANNELTSLASDEFDGLTGLRVLRLEGNEIWGLWSSQFDGLTNLQELWLSDNNIGTMSPDQFNGLTNLRVLRLEGNRMKLLQLTSGGHTLTNLQELWLSNNRLLDDGIGRRLDGLTSLRVLRVDGNQFTALPQHWFWGLTSLQELWLSDGRLRSLHHAAFDDLTSLRVLHLEHNELTTLPQGVFDGLTSLQELYLHGNRLEKMPGALGGLTRPNRLGELPAGVFDDLTSLRVLRLDGNELTTLPAGLFDELASLQELDLRGNHLVGLTRDDPLFARLSSVVDILVASQTEPVPLSPVRLAAAAPLMLSAADSTRQGFVRIVNESEDFGGVRVFAFDDGGHAPDPIELRLSTGQVVHFNSNDLEDGNARKGIEGGLGGPVQGDWRLDVESTLQVRGLAFVRTTDGFLTAMHDVLPRDDEGRLAAQTFNPGSNMNQASKLRLVNAGADDESVSIVGVDDEGNDGGPVTLTLPAGESRTLSAFDLENGAQGLDGSLGDGAGKWRLFVDAGESVVGMSLLEAVSGHLTNLSTMGVATGGGTQERLAAAVPLMLSTADSTRQGFVRIVNESEESGSVRVLAFDDGGHAPDPIEIPLGAGQVVHFNSNDLEDGNEKKGIEEGVGGPVQGDWRLDVETALPVRVLAFVRTTHGFLTAMHDVLPRNGEGRLAAHTFNPGSNANQASKLRLVNAGADEESVSIEGVDDQGYAAGPVTLTLPAGESRTLSAFDLENGADGLTGTLGDGAGKWRLFVDAGESVVGMSLLEAVSGHLTNISTAGVADE